MADEGTSSVVIEALSVDGKIMSVIYLLRSHGLSVAEDDGYVALEFDGVGVGDVSTNVVTALV